ncbi:VIT family protein [soil metagenome]
MRHPERHLVGRVGWLRASVLGANDGIISTAALLLGVAAAEANRNAILTAGIAGLVAGAISMALGEFVSVSSQLDAERADIAKETWELEHQADHELEELTAIYKTKGLSSKLAAEVAVQLTAHDALGAHLRDELGITRELLARPLQAAWSSAAAFSVGSSLPLIAVILASTSLRIISIVVLTLIALIGLGFAGARAAGVSPLKPIARVVVGGAVAMSATSLIGWLFGKLFL